MIYAGQPFASPGDALKHFGIKGMRWGVRKEKRLSSHENYNKDFVQKEDVYRIIAKEGSRKMSDIAYVSTNDIDNNRYIHILNNTVSARLFKDARYEKQLVLGPTKPLKAPSIQKAEKEMQKLYEDSPSFKSFVKRNALFFGENPSPKKINQITNSAMVDDDRLFQGSIKMRKEVKDHFQARGYNSLLDQNDIREGLAKKPLIVFDPEKNLRVVSQSKIDEVIKASAKKTYKETKKSGWV